MSDRTLLDVPGTTLAFYGYEEEGIAYIEFDASECAPPEPMMNAMKGFELIADSDRRLVMINAQEPVPLYPRIADSFCWDVEVLEDGNVKIIFKKRV